jgi:hypothetical protein
MAIAEVGSGSQRANNGSEGPVDAFSGVAYPANVTAGNLLLVTAGIWQTGSGPASVSVTDTRGTSYTVLLFTGLGYAGGTAKSMIAYGIAPSSGANTVTVDPSSTGNWGQVYIDEFSGVHATPLDADGGQSTGSGFSPSDGITTLSDGALVVGVGVWDGIATFTAGGGATLIGQETDGNQPGAVQFLVEGAAGAKTSSGSLSTPRGWAFATASFAAAGGAPVIAPPSDLRIVQVIRRRVPRRVYG